MKANIQNFNMINAKDLKDVFKYLNSKKESWKIFAGGSDLMVLLEMGNLPEGNYLSISNVKELSKISVKTDTIEIGAAVTFRTIAEHKDIQKEFALLVDAASQVGAIAIQNRATIGGNIANASPAADTPPALLAYDAQLEISSSKVTRYISLSDFYLGYKKIDLTSGELITKIILPRNCDRKIGTYQKVGPRKAMAISKVVFCANAKVTKGVIKDIRIALGSVAPISKNIKSVEQYLIGKKVEPATISETLALLDQEISPISDIRSTNIYRKKVTENLLSTFLNSLKS